MDVFWSECAKKYGDAHDLEEKIRVMVGKTVRDEFQGDPANAFNILELACGNGKVIQKIIPFLRIGDLVFGVDSSNEMIEECKKRISDPRCIFLSQEFFDYINNTEKQFNIVICCNSLHNLPNRLAIHNAICSMCEVVKPGGLIIFDIRNLFNPFVNRGYHHNRSKGLYFNTFSFFLAKRLLLNNGFKLQYCKPIFYSSLKDAGKNRHGFLFGVAYRLYLMLTSYVFFSQYVLICAKKKI